MCQIYHSNASTNQHVREIIQKSDLANVELANKYSINVQTVSKWRNRDYQEDKSSRPNVIHYALSDLEKELINLSSTN
jgi:DNA-binding transcriptional regulator YiaG